MKTESFWNSRLFYFIVFAVSTITMFAVGVALTLILERRSENLLMPVVFEQLDPGEADSSKWERNFPREYESFMMTKQSGEPTLHGGPQPFDHLKRNPGLKTMYSGYSFSVEYLEDRGHYWALEDVTKTGRMDVSRGGKPMPGTCINCKTSDLPNLYSKHTPAGVFKMSFDDIRAETEHTIGCANCHDGSTLELRLTNVALIEALEKDGRRAEDLSRQEMRSMVCANCHVEYYFAKDAYLTLPWDNGRKPEQMLDYYDSIDFKDWTNATSGADMVKMQHPDYELFTTGVHYKRGLACADCHMPYSSQGGVKYTDHHVQSPLKNVGNVCLVCHRFSEQEAIDLVHERQNIVWDLQKRACDLLAIAHEEVGKAAEDFSDEQLASVRYNLRASQIRVDYMASSNSMGFHSPQEAARILSEGIDLAQEARLELSRLKE